MKNLLRKLDYLCIESIGKNIKRWSKTPGKHWIKRNCNDLGERLILAALSNLAMEGVDDDCYLFILENFYVKRLKISLKMFDTIQYVDFLNGKSFDILDMNLKYPLKLKNKDNFRVTINTLILHFPEDDLIFSKCFNIFKNMIVNKVIIINAFQFQEFSSCYIEQLIIRILKSASNELETIELQLNYATSCFLMELADCLKCKKNLKNINFDFFHIFRREVLINYFQTSVFHLSSFRMSTFKNIWNLKTLNRCFKNLVTLEKLVIWLSADIVLEDYNELRTFFLLLESKNLTSMRELELNLPQISRYQTEFSNFLKSCSRLERFSFIEEKDNILCKQDYFDSLLPASKTLKTFELKYSVLRTRGEIESLKILFSYTSLLDISLVDVRFAKGVFTDFLDSIENSQFQLSIFILMDCEIPYSEFEVLPDSLVKINKLKFIKVFHQIIKRKCFLAIFNGLRSSYKTLEKIYISSNTTQKKRMEDCPELFLLFEECKKLNTIKIEIFLVDDLIPELLLTLYKFQHILNELDIGFCYSPQRITELLEFLNSCTTLVAISGNAIGEMKNWPRIIKSLENSKYSLEKVPYFDLQTLDILNNFPNLTFYNFTF